MKYTFIIFFSFYFFGCSSNTILPNQTIDSVKIYDLENLPQESKSYLENLDDDGLATTQEKYEQEYFRVWNNIPTDTKEVSMWPFRAYKAGDSYGENLHPIEGEFFIEMEDNSNFESYKSINKNALTLNHLSIRAFPTSKPLLHNPNLAGEGFPFDYMQNSTVSANKPILVSHYSKDKEWAYIFTSFTGGWVKTSDIVIVDKKYTDIWQKAQQIVLIKDGVSIYSQDGRFLFKSRVGMMLALVDEDEKDYTVLTISTYKGSKPLYLKSKISKKIANKGILNFNKKNIELVMNEISKSKYGWGGIYNQRDCSSTLRDFYAPFGLWLPRNSFQQAAVGDIIRLDNISNDEKIQIIKQKAIPFKTLLYKKGHILLYVGTYKDTVVAFHNIWGIKTKIDKMDGRLILGKALFSSLELGKNQKGYDHENGILNGLESLNIINQ